MDRARGIDRRRTVADRPGPDLVGPGGEERDQAEQPVATGAMTRSRPDSAIPSSSMNDRRLLGLQLADLHLDPRRQRLDQRVLVLVRAPRCRRRAPRAAAMSLSPMLSRTSTGFWVRNRKPRIAFSSSASSSTSRIGRPASRAGLRAARRIDHLALVGFALGRRAVASARREPLEPPLDHREVGEHELEVEPLEVAPRVDRALRVWHRRVLERADDVEQRVGVAQPGELLRRQLLGPDVPSVEAGGAGRST